MKSQVLTIVCAAILASCSKQSADTLPPFPKIEEATVAYANCLDESGRSLAAQQGQTELLAYRTVASCRKLHSRAIALKVVPVMFPTIAEYDAFHFRMARRAVEVSRAKR